jgi:hypothetical protein
MLPSLGLSLFPSSHLLLFIFALTTIPFSMLVASPLCTCYYSFLCLQLFPFLRLLVILFVLVIIPYFMLASNPLCTY